MENTKKILGEITEKMNIFFELSDVKSPKKGRNVYTEPIG